MKRFMKQPIWLKAIGISVGLLMVLALVLQSSRVSRAALNPAPPPPAAAIHLTALSATFTHPIGIDWSEFLGKLIVSDFYPAGDPENFNSLDPSGNPTGFSNVHFRPDELKLAVVHATVGGFTAGDVYAGNGAPCQILKLDKASGPLTAPAADPFSVLPCTTAQLAHTRGSLFHDRYGVAGGNLIVVTGDDQVVGTPNVGQVWRVNSLGAATLVHDFQKHLEGVITVPNDVTKYGPIAGRILVGDEDRVVLSGGVQTNGSQCRVLAVEPTTGAFITLSTNPTGAGNYQLDTPLCPEDLDIIPHNAPFYGVNFSDNRILTAPAADFASFCGDILVTHEFPSGNSSVLPAAGVSGLFVLHWNAAGTGSFEVTPLSTDLTIRQWEHVTFAGGTDCQVCIPANSLFNLGQAEPFSVLYLTGANAITGGDSTINGNVGIAAFVTGSLIKLQLNGNLVKDPLFDDSIIKDNFKVSGTTTVASLTPAVNDALAANAAFCAAAPTQTLPAITGNATINVVSGLNVVAIPFVNTHDVITINGPSNAAVVFKIAGGFTCNGCTINGSVPAQNILWNFCGTGDDVSISKPVGSTRGIFLAPDRNILLDKATNVGALIGARNGLKLLIHSAATLTSPCP